MTAPLPVPPVQQNGSPISLGWLSGYKTYICVALALVVILLTHFGIVDKDTAQPLLAALGFGGLAALRTSIPKQLLVVVALGVTLVSLPACNTATPADLAKLQPIVTAAAQGLATVGCAQIPPDSRAMALDILAKADTYLTLDPAALLDKLTQLDKTNPGMAWLWSALHDAIGTVTNWLFNVSSQEWAQLFKGAAHPAIVACMSAMGAVPLIPDVVVGTTQG